MALDPPFADRQDLRPHVTAVVLHWGQHVKTARCLASLAAASWTGRLDIVVVDNARTFHDHDIERAAPLPVRVERPPRNLGFCGGCNLGMELAIQAGAAFVLLLNNDAFVDPLFLDPLVTAATQAPDTGLVCPRIVEAENPARVWYQGAQFSLWTGIPVQARRWSPKSLGHEPREVDYATGCAMLVRPALLEKTGFFDVRFFAYCEDLDLSIRARQAGFRVLYVPESTVYHDVRADPGASSLRIYYSTRNLMEVMRKHAAWYQWPVFGVNFLARWLGFFAALSLLRRQPGQLVALIRGIVDFALGRLGEKMPR